MMAKETIIDIRKILSLSTWCEKGSTHVFEVVIPFLGNNTANVRLSKHYNPVVANTETGTTYTYNHQNNIYIVRSEFTDTFDKYWFRFVSQRRKVTKSKRNGYTFVRYGYYFRLIEEEKNG